jgi:5'(3')-deoxyribonucleotidase
MKIAIDVDGVLADIHTAIFNYLKLPYKVEDIKKWDFFEDLGIEPKTFWNAYKKLWTEHYEDIPLIDEDSPIVIEKLMRRHIVDIVTCKPVETVGGAVRWLYFRKIPFNDFVFLRPSDDKLKIKKYNLFVDDNPKMARSRRVVIFDRPWNRNVLRAKILGIKRIYSLRDLLQLLGVE